MKRDVELHIEEIVLHGFAPGDRYRIREAIQQELTRLFTDASVPALLSQSRESSRLDGGAFEIANGARPESIGAQIGRAVYRSFAGMKSTR